MAGSGLRIKPCVPGGVMVMVEGTEALAGRRKKTRRRRWRGEDSGAASVPKSGSGSAAGRLVDFPGHDTCHDVLLIVSTLLSGTEAETGSVAEGSSAAGAEGSSEVPAEGSAEVAGPRMTLGYHSTIRTFVPASLNSKRARCWASTVGTIGALPADTDVGTDADAVAVAVVDNDVGREEPEEGPAVMI